MIRKLILAALLLASCGQGNADSADAAQRRPARPANAQTALFAGGCFWSAERDVEAIPGVVEAVSGFAGGTVANPSYERVVRGGTGHLEAVRVTYDPRKVSYPKLLDVFWHNIDPVAVNRQFCDVGDQYRSAIFPIGPQQHSEA